MTVIYLNATVANPQNPKKKVVGRFLVDSGAVYSVMPASALKKLGIKPTDVQKFSLANGDVIEKKVGNAYFIFQGKMRSSPVVFGEKDIFLLGAVTLESHGVILDPINRELKPLPMLLMALPTINFVPGDTVRVHQKVSEVVTAAGKTKKSIVSEVKTRTQIFEGVVLAIKGMGENKMFMVRKKSYDGVNVERIWPVNSPYLVKVEVKTKPKKPVRRAKLYYLRNIAHA